LYVKSNEVFASLNILLFLHISYNPFLENKIIMAKNKKIEVKGQNISLFINNAENYVSLTDMARYKDAERTNYIIQNWMRTRSAIEFCGLWELLYNPNFKSIEFDAFKNDSGANSFSLTPQKWIESTRAIGLSAKAKAPNLGFPKAPN